MSVEGKRLGLERWDVLARRASDEGLAWLTINHVHMENRNTGL